MSLDAVIVDGVGQRSDVGSSTSGSTRGDDINSATWHDTAGSESTSQGGFGLRGVAVWGLCLALVLIFAFRDGGYDTATHDQVGLGLWWIVVVGAAWRLLPSRPLDRPGLAALGLLAGFTAWTAIGITWSISAGRSFQDLGLIDAYLGVFALGLLIHRHRREAVRQTVTPVALGIVIVAAVALIARLWPGTFAGSTTVNQLAHNSARLAWPLNYWNGLAALMVLGLPLLLALAASKRQLLIRSLAAAGIPLVALCGALTLSRGGAIAGGVAVITYVLLAPGVVTKLLSVIVTGGAAALAIAAGFGHKAVQQGLTGPVEHRQAGQLALELVLLCLAAGVLQTLCALVDQHIPRPAPPKVVRRHARALWAAGTVVLVAIGLAVGGHRLEHAWHDFKNPVNTTSGTSTSRLLGSASGEGRYQYWQAAVNAGNKRPLNGWGPGTFQLLWLPNAPIASYVENAHDLYVETYAELGLVGLVLLAGFFVVILAAAVRLALTRAPADRTLAAGVAAAILAFMVFAAYDWVWQLPAVSVVVLLLGAAVVAPSFASRRRSHLRYRPRYSARVTSVMAAGALLCLVGVGYPLAVNTAIADSQSAARKGQLGAALADANRAVSLESDSGPAQLQLALVLEAEHHSQAALAAANKAVQNEGQNWVNWLTLSRIQAEAGDPSGSIASYKRAKSLNPRSPSLKK